MCCCPNIEVTVFLSRYRTRGTMYLRELPADIVVYLLIWRQNMQNGDCSYIINLILPGIKRNQASIYLDGWRIPQDVWPLITMPTTGDIWRTSGVWSAIDTVVVLFICKSKGKAMMSRLYKIFLPSLRKFRIYSGLSMVRWCLVSLYFLTYSVYWNVSIDVELINNKTECERYLIF